MQRKIVAGAVIVLVAIALAVIFLGGEETRQAETAGAPDIAMSEPAGALEGAGATESAGATEGGATGAAGATEGETQQQQAAAQSQTTVQATTSGAVVQSTGAASQTQSAAVPPEEGPAPVVPRFDVVRVEANGDAVIAGVAAPNSIVILLDGDTEIARVQADRTGAWVIVLDTPLAPGDHQLSLRVEEPDGTVRLSDAVVVVSVPRPETAVASAGAQGTTGGQTGTEGATGGQTETQGAAGGQTQAAAGAQIAGTTTAQQAGTLPLAVLVPREGEGASRVLQQPAEGEGLGDHELLLDAVDYNAAGFVVISGRAAPGARVIVYLDDEAIGYGVAGADGRWEVAPAQPVAAGLHRLRVDQVDSAGTVLARVATLFSREELAEGFPQDRFVIVQPGNSLWRIARRTYGDGVRYSVIFQANERQIRDPDLIYPGQIFLIPTVN